MQLKEIIDWGSISEYAHMKELKFREEMEVDDYSKLEGMIINWLTENKHVELVQDFIKNINYHIYGEILEIGAGSCWLSGVLSKYEKVVHINAVEFSKTRLSKWSPIAIKYVGGIADKITRIVGDFNQLKFEDNKFDFAFVDGAIHHAKDINKVLSEVYRVLKPGGKFYAFREQMYPIWRPSIKNNKGEADEFLIENCFSIKEYKYYFEKAGFKFKKYPIFSDSTFKYFGFKIPGWLKKYSLLRFFNGYLYSSFILEGKK